MRSEHPRNRQHLKRLPDEYYRGQTYVHWTLCTENRKTGWLTPNFYYKFRELLTHTMFRFDVCCPLFCCMPDHIHMLWVGLSAAADQRIGMRYLRKHVNAILGYYGVVLQRQGYDHVLQDDERMESGFEAIAEYIARNPERKGLVPIDGYASYPYTGCLVPGYPELKPFHDQYWFRFWRTYSYLRTHGTRQVGPNERQSDNS